MLDGKACAVYSSAVYRNVIFPKCILHVLDIFESDSGASRYRSSGNGEFDVKLLCLTAKNVLL